MTNKITSAIGTIIGFALIILIGIGVYKVLIAIGEAIRAVHWFSLNPVIAAAIIAGLISLVSLIVGQLLNRVQAVKLENRKKQVKAYDNFLEALFNFFNETDAQKKDKYLEGLNREFTKNVLLWSSNRVLKKFFEYKEYAKNNPDNGMGVLGQLEELIIAMRRDLGHRKKMKAGELLSIMFNETSAQLKVMLGGKKPS